MFDNYVFTKDSCRNFTENGKIAGFEMETLITYYRGIPLSMVNEVRITVDGLPVPAEFIKISADNEQWFTLEEMETVTFYKWEYGEPLHIRAYIEDGLRKGEHDVNLFVSIWPAYYPMPAGGTRTRKVTIA